ncbi:MAG: hypothetical protein NTV34_18055, partial [Proteobacteria bacterium]|nr:hypothetical protein [Pseudomonadota bacterium]
LWRIKGDYFSSLRDSEGAISAYEKAVQIDSKCFRAHRGLGYAAWVGHSHDDAMTFFKRALMLEHNDYHSLVGVGLIYRRLRMLEESVFWLGRAVDIGGVESTALNLLLQACLEAPEAAISLLTIEQLRESFGDISKIVRGLSQVYIAQGMDEKAAPLLELASA